MTLLKLKSPGKGESLNLQIGQVNEIDVGLIDDIRKVLMPVPFNPPSQALMEMLGFLVETGKGVVQTSFEKLTDMNANAPVGTTLALIEQGLQVYSAIYTRIYWGEQEEFSLLYRNIGKYATQAVKQDYLDVLDDPEADFDKDFNRRDMDIRPVSDPASVTKLQQMARAQFLGGFVNLPWMNGPAITKRMLEAADVEYTEELFVQQQPPQPDPLQIASAQEKEASANLKTQQGLTEVAKREQMAVDAFAKGFGMMAQPGSNV